MNMSGGKFMAPQSEQAHDTIDPVRKDNWVAASGRKYGEEEEE